MSLMAVDEALPTWLISITVDNGQGYWSAFILTGQSAWEDFSCSCRLPLLVSTGGSSFPPVTTNVGFPVCLSCQLVSSKGQQLGQQRGSVRQILIEGIKGEQKGRREGGNKKRRR